MDSTTLPEHAVGRGRPLMQLPGVRTFRSSRFRTAVAATLLAIVVGLLGALLLRQSADPAGQYGIDFEYWHRAAQDVSAGVSPYPRRYLDGPVVGTDFGYKYPPTFAQALQPLAGLPFLTAATVWAAIQAASAFLAVWLAARYGGARRTVELALWSGVAAALYLPAWDSIWKGNVSAVQALQVGLILGGGAMAGSALATAILLKTTPVAMVPAAALRRGRLAGAALLTGVVLLALSVVASPGAWLDFARIQGNLLAGASISPTNVHPASIVALAVPELPAAGTIVRLGSLGVAGLAILAAAVLARRVDGWAAAVTLGVVAMLLVPGSAWYHYLAVLLPLGAFAWPRGSARQRGLLLIGAAAVSFGLAWLPLAVLGSFIMVLATLAVVRPRSTLSPRRTSLRQLG